MTLEQIRKMTGGEINRAIEELLPEREYRLYSTDLNEAMLLVPQDDANAFNDFEACLDKMMGPHSRDEAWYEWGKYIRNKPRALCEAFLLWKGGAE